MLSFLLHAVTGIVYVLVFAYIFKLVTPQNEDKLIQEKNISAAIVHGGKVLGLTIVVASAIANSVSYPDMAIWAFFGGVAQIITYFLHDLVTPKLKFRKEIEENNYAAALQIATVNIAVGIIIAASMTY